MRAYRYCACKQTLTASNALRREERGQGGGAAPKIASAEKVALDVAQALRDTWFMHVSGLPGRGRWRWLALASVVLLASAFAGSQASTQAMSQVPREEMVEPDSDVSLVELPLCPSGLTLDIASLECSGVASVAALKKCAAPPSGSSVVLRDGKCVVSSVSVLDPVVSCYATTEDPLSWTFDSESGECVATVTESY